MTKEKSQKNKQELLKREFNSHNNSQNNSSKEFNTRQNCPDAVWEVF